MDEKSAMLEHLAEQGISKHIMRAIRDVPREHFMLPMFIDKAHVDSAFPIEADQTISQPSVVALMTDALEINASHMVLEIGTGSGYQAAILSKIARRVHTVERIADLHEQASRRFEQLKLRNITAHLGDGHDGWKAAAPYDRMMLTAAASELPLALLEQLRDGGVMVAPIGPESVEQRLIKITKRGEAYHQEALASVRFVPMCVGVI